MHRATHVLLTAEHDGYEFANDVTALFVDLRGEQPLSDLYRRLTGVSQTFTQVAHDAKLSQARTAVSPEIDKLRALYDHPQLEKAVSSLEVYRTLVRPAVRGTRRAGRPRRARRPRRGPACRAGARARRARGVRRALPADHRLGDGKGRRGHRVLSLPTADRAQRGGRRPRALLAARR